MNRLSRPTPFLAAALAFGGLLAASAAHARTDVHFSIGIHAPAPVYVQPAPVYVQPQPVYVQPGPVYVEPRPVYVEPRPVYFQPRPVYVQPQPVYAHPRTRYVQPAPVHYGYDRPRGRRGWGDADGDGVPNRYDRAPRNPYYR